MPFRDWLRMKGWNFTNLTPEELLLLRDCWEKECLPATPGDGPSPPRISLPPRPMIRANAGSRDTPRAFSLAAPVAVRAASGNGEMGKLPTFEGCAYTGQPMCPEGWWLPVIVDLDGVTIPSQERPVLRQHDSEQIVGHTTSIKVDKSGIQVAGVFSGQPKHTDKVVVPALNGFPWQLSIGANPVRTEFLEAGEEAKVNGRTVTGPLTICRETEFGEVSFVPIGADQDTTVKVMAQGGKMNPYVMALKATLAELRASGRPEGVTLASRWTDEQVEKMTPEEAKAALREVMTPAPAPAPAPTPAPTPEPVPEPVAARHAAMFQGELAQAMQAMRAQAASEFTRQADITSRVRTHGVTEVEITENGQPRRVNLVAHAIASGWTADQAELLALRAARPGPGVGVPGGLGYSTARPEVNEAVLESAVFHAARHQFSLTDDAFYFDQVQGSGGTQGLARRVPAHIQQETQSFLKARYTDQVQQAAHTMFRGRIGLQELFISAGRANGYTGPDRVRDDGQIKEMLRAQNWDPKQGIRADGFSTASIANVLSNVLNKFMLQGYLFVEQTWRDSAAIRPVNDFKPTKSINLLGDFVFKQVPNTGELEDATLSDQAFANQADQYGRIITISRKNIINDDLGILTTVPMKIGQGAGLSLNKVYWTAFLALASATADDGNPFFNSTGSPATHGPSPLGQLQAGPNLLTGAGSALSSASLAQAKALFDRQVDPNGNPLGFDVATPTLVFPPELWQTAMELVDPAAIGLVYGGSTAARQPNINLWKGRLKPVMSRYLSSPNFAGSSATAWYILFNPAALAAMEVAFLNGMDTPTVQTASPDFQFDRLGVSIRGVMDFGVNAQSFRAVVKSNGA